MPLRLPCRPVQLSPGNLIYAYRGTSGFHRPVLDAFVIGPGNRITVAPAQIDTASDYTVFTSAVAHKLGISLPFPRCLTISGAAGGHTSIISFPPDGLVTLFVTDYREYYYLPAPLIGFHPPGPGSAGQRSVLGLAGFLEFFRFVLDPNPTPPVFELDHIPSFLGQTGLLPRGRSLDDIIRGLREP